MTPSGPQSHFLPYKAGWWPSARGDNEGRWGLACEPSCSCLLGASVVDQRGFPGYFFSSSDCRGSSSAHIPLEFSSCGGGSSASVAPCRAGDLAQPCRESQQLCHPLEEQLCPGSPPVTALPALSWAGDASSIPGSGAPGWPGRAQGSVCSCHMRGGTNITPAPR